MLNWYALVAPRGLPRAITARLNAALRAAQADPEAVRKLAAQGVEPLPSSPEEATRFLTEEVAKWRAVVQAARIGLD